MNLHGKRRAGRSKAKPDRERRRRELARRRRNVSIRNAPEPAKSGAGVITPMNAVKRFAEWKADVADTVPSAAVWTHGLDGGSPVPLGWWFRIMRTGTWTERMLVCAMLLRLSAISLRKMPPGYGCREDRLATRAIERLRSASSLRRWPDLVGKRLFWPARKVMARWIRDTRNAVRESIRATEDMLASVPEPVIDCLPDPSLGKGLRAPLREKRAADMEAITGESPARRGRRRSAGDSTG